MKYLYHTAIYLIIGVCIANVQAQNFKFEPKYNTTISPDKASLILNQDSRTTPKFVSNYFNPTQNDIQKLHLNLKKLTSIKSAKGKQIGNLNKYVYQYVGIIIDGKRYIYINAFHTKLFETFPKWEDIWKKEPIIMYDGGDAYWGALFNIDRASFSQLTFNKKIVIF